MKIEPPEDPKPYLDSGGNIKEDLKPEQLAEIGAIALARHALDLSIESMIESSLHGNWLLMEVIEKCRSYNDKIALSKKCISQGNLEEKIKKLLHSSLEDVANYIDWSNTVIHCAVINKSTGIGLNIKKGTPTWVLLELEALTKLYDILVAFQMEFAIASTLISESVEDSCHSGQDKSRIESKVQVSTLEYQSLRNERLSVSRPKKFPAKSAILAAVNLQKSILAASNMGWYVPWEQPIRPPHRMAVFDPPSPGYVPMPSPEEKKD